MLEGLEISVINKSQLERTLRIDSEFYSKENLEIQEVLYLHDTAKITELTNVSDGNHMSISEKFTKKGIPYYRGQDIHNFFIEQSNPICIDEKTFNISHMKRSHLKKGDVLLSIVGTIGGVSLVSKRESATCNCKLAILRPKKIDGFYLATFLKSKYGQNQIKKFTRGAVQMGLILEDMDQILIPVLSIDFQNIIRNFVDNAKGKLEMSRKAYADAENLLLEEVGLNKFQSSKESVNIKGFKDSFVTSGRLDAEYYQPKYEQIIYEIINQSHDKLKKLVSIKKSIEPGSNYYSDEGLPFLRVSDYSKYKIKPPKKKLSFEFCKENAELIKKLKPKKETILFSKDGSVGIAYMLRENMEMVTSGAVLHLTVKDKKLILPEYLTLVLNSELVQMQAERDAGGSIILHWRINEIENVVIPIISYSKQKKIAGLIDKSFQLKRESDFLLKIAKNAVEIAIDKNEEVAIYYIKELDK